MMFLQQFARRNRLHTRCSAPLLAIVSNVSRGIVSDSSCYSVISEGDKATTSDFVSTRPAQYRYALMRDIDPTLAREALRLSTSTDDSDAVNLDVANQHHAALTHVLSSACGLSVLHLPGDGFPDSVFIEDTAVVVGDVALITQPGAVSRRGEVDRVRQALLHPSAAAPSSSPPAVSLPSMRVAELERGTLDGGDVLFTGQEFFVGISHRTNLAGIESLAKVFSAHRVTAVDITHPAFTTPLAEDDGGSVTASSPPSPPYAHAQAPPPLHLKSMCCRAGARTLLLGGSAGHVMAGVVSSVAPGRYELVHVPDMSAANCVWANDVLVRPLSSEMSAESSRVLDTLSGSHVQVATSELAKLDGAITCCSVLVE